MVINLNGVSVADEPKFVMTRQRRMILEEVRNTDSHPSADEIYHRVRAKLPRISLGTVYRTLDLLSERGLIRKLELGGSQRRFDHRTHHHYHFRCLACQRLTDVDAQNFACLKATPRELAGCQLQGHQLEFFGLCPECLAAGRRQTGRTSEAEDRPADEQKNTNRN